VLRISPRRLLVNRSPFTLGIGVAGIPVDQFWTHALAARRFWKGCKRLPNGSGYDEVCRRSTGGGRDHQSGEQLRKLVDSLRRGEVRDAVVAYDLGDVAELYGGHHRAIAALEAERDLPVVYRSFDPLSRVADVADAKKAYDAVQKYENLSPGRSYNPFPGRRPFRKSADRMRMLYRAVIDVPGSLLLDAGCNDGYFGVTLSDHGFDPTFVDQSEAYCDVVRAKMRALGKSAANVQCSTLRSASLKKYGVVLYTDVFYHAATKQSLGAAMDDWRMLMSATKRRMIFCPGRWDKLTAVGFTEKMMWDASRKAGFRIRYLGHDDDPGYGRPLFCLER